MACNIKTAIRWAHFRVNVAINIPLPSISRLQLIKNSTHLFSDVNVAVLAQVEHRVNALVHQVLKISEKSRNELGA